MDKVNPMSFVGEMGANMAWFAHEQEKKSQQADEPVEKSEAKTEIKPETMVIDLGFTKLVAEKFDNDNGQGIVIGMFDANGDWQDIAVVEHENGTKNVRCFVYGDAAIEDYTNKFEIDQYKTD